MEFQSRICFVKTVRMTEIANIILLYTTDVYKRQTYDDQVHRRNSIVISELKNKKFKKNLRRNFFKTLTYSLLVRFLLIT